MKSIEERTKQNLPKKLKGKKKLYLLGKFFLLRTAGYNIFKLPWKFAYLIYLTHNQDPMDLQEIRVKFEVLGTKAPILFLEDFPQKVEKRHCFLEFFRNHVHFKKTILGHFYFHCRYWSY